MELPVATADVDCCKEFSLGIHVILFTPHIVRSHLLFVLSPRVVKRVKKPRMENEIMKVISEVTGAKFQVKAPKRTERQPVTEKPEVLTVGPVESRADFFATLSQK